MQVTLVDHTENPEEKIGHFAAICYDSNTDSDNCVRRAASCVSKGHLATLRFAYATFLISDISRTCSHQLVRSKHLDFLQESQRYVNQVECGFVYPGTKEDTLISSAYQSAMAVYEELIKRGVKKEDARFVLPNGGKTSLYVTGNFQAWLDFIKLRSGKEAQWEVRSVAHEINRQLAGIAPNIFKVEDGNNTCKCSTSGCC